MPILELPQLHLPEAGAYLEAVMLWPRQPERHQRLIQAVRKEAINRVLAKRNGRPLAIEALEMVAESHLAPDLRELAGADLGHLLSRRFLVVRRDAAAQIFIYVLACCAAGDSAEPATLEHARNMLGTAGGRFVGYPGFGRSELIDIWRDFSPAVHLLAARQFVPWDQRGTLPQGPFLTAFLTCAEQLRLMGEQHRPPRAKSALLDGSETWKIPEWCLLPKEPKIEFPAPALLKAELQKWPSPRDVRRLADMSA